VRGLEVSTMMFGPGDPSEEESMKYRAHLPQLGDDLFLTDGGIETVLIFHEGLDLPLFAAFDLLKDEQGTERLRGYYAPYVALARERGLGFVLESPTWRASPRWAAELGYELEELERLNRKAIALLEEIREENEGDGSPIVISGCIGPQDDGYDPAELLSAEAAQEYHSTQIGTFAETAADMVTAITMTYVEEAIGIARAAGEAGIPAAVSFTVETDGRLPSGQPLGEAIEQVDEEAGASPSYYMINCAHPTHFEVVLAQDGDWRERIAGLRANASTCSHAELDEAEELDEGDPADLGARYAGLRERLPRLTVLGGCCGTDHRHVAEIRDAWLRAAPAGRP
jgi:S-methylmethionine-dependent homocysteine/selenocysteine methylase